MQVNFDCEFLKKNQSKVCLLRLSLQCSVCGWRQYWELISTICLQGLMQFESLHPPPPFMAHRCFRGTVVPAYAPGKCSLTATSIMAWHGFCRGPHSHQQCTHVIGGYCATLSWCLKDYLSEPAQNLDYCQETLPFCAYCCVLNSHATVLLRRTGTDLFFKNAVNLYMCYTNIY